MFSSSSLMLAIHGRPLGVYTGAFCFEFQEHSANDYVAAKKQIPE